MKGQMDCCRRYYPPSPGYDACCSRRWNTLIRYSADCRTPVFVGALSRGVLVGEIVVDPIYMCPPLSRDSDVLSCNNCIRFISPYPIYQKRARCTYAQACVMCQHRSQFHKGKLQNDLSSPAQTFLTFFNSSIPSETC